MGSMPSCSLGYGLGLVSRTARSGEWIVRPSVRRRANAGALPPHQKVDSFAKPPVHAMYFPTIYRNAILSVLFRAFGPSFVVDDDGCAPIPPLPGAAADEDSDDD